MYKTAHKAVCRVICVCATLTLPCENKKYKCVVFFYLNLKISEHCYTNLWSYGTITVVSALQTRKTESTGLGSDGLGISVSALFLLDRRHRAAQPCRGSCVALRGENKAPLPPGEQMV